MRTSAEKLPTFAAVLLGKLELIKSTYGRDAAKKLGVPPRRWRAWLSRWPRNVKDLERIEEHYSICWTLREVDRATNRRDYERQKVRHAIEGKPSAFEPPPTANDERSEPIFSDAEAKVASKTYGNGIGVK